MTVTTEAKPATAKTFRPKPGDDLTYTVPFDMSGGNKMRKAHLLFELAAPKRNHRRTGIVLDRAAWVHHGWNPTTAQWEHFDHGYAVWVHRKDGLFDKVAVTTKGPRMGETEWLGTFTVGGVELPTRMPNHCQCERTHLFAITSPLSDGSQDVVLYADHLERDRAVFCMVANKITGVGRHNVHVEGA